MRLTIEMDDPSQLAIPPWLVALIPILLELLKKFLESRKNGMDLSPNP